LIPDHRQRFVATVAAQYGRRLRAFLAARLRNSADIADLAQEVFLRLLRVDAHEQIRNPEAYLLTVASHVIHQHSLNASSHQAESLDGLDEQLNGGLGEDPDVGSRDGVFASSFAASPDRQNFPAYAKTDLSTGIRRDSWTVSLFANNVTDKRGVLTGGLGTINPAAFEYIQPRTVGLSASHDF
jgi:hypothetical protein